MANASEVPALLTVGVLAQELGVPVSKISYVLQSRPNLQECARAGTLRLFDRATAGKIGEELQLIEQRRPPVSAAETH